MYTKTEVLKALQVTIMDVLGAGRALPDPNSRLDVACPERLDRVDVRIELEDDLDVKIPEEVFEENLNASLIEIADALHALL